MASKDHLRPPASNGESQFYEIRIHGFLDPSWSPRMGDLKIESRKSAQELRVPVVQLCTVGSVRD